MASGSGCESLREVFRAAHLDRLKPQRQRLGRTACVSFKNTAWIGFPGFMRVATREILGRTSFSSSKRFPWSSGFRRLSPRQIPIWPGKARDESDSHGIADGHHDDGNRGGGVLSCQGTRCRRHDQDVNLIVDQVGHEGWKALVSSLGPADFQGYGPPLHIAQFA